MHFLYRILKKDPATREGIIATSSVLSIGVSLLLSVGKVVVGILVSSMAIVSEGINNATDVLSSLLTLVGTKLATKHPDEKHPFGYGRIEYLTSLVVSALILFTGIEVLISSVKCLWHPEPLHISLWALALVIISAIVKFFLGTYLISMGKVANSDSLIGVGKESRNDSFASILTIASALLFLFFNISVDAYASIVIAVLICKTGWDILKTTIHELLGRPGEKELAQKLYKEIRSTEGILGAADMMLHNYGPGAYSGSVNIEIDQGKSVGEVYQFLHELQLRIMHEYKVTLVFGVYAVDQDHPELKELRKRITAFVREQEHLKSYHALYVEPETHKIYCDFIVDYSLHDWEALELDFKAYMQTWYPNRAIELTIETEFV